MTAPFRQMFAALAPRGVLLAGVSLFALVVAGPVLADPNVTVDPNAVGPGDAYKGPVTTHLHRHKKGHVEKAAAGPAATPLAAVSISGGEHKGLSRLLISWHAPVTYKVEEAPGTVTITFNRPGKPYLTPVVKQPMRDIQAVSIVEDDPAHLVVKLAVKSGARSRAFKTGNIVIVDVLDGGDTAATPTAPTAVTAATTTGEKTEGVADTVIHVQPATQSAGLAAFRRGPYLWLAVDDTLPEGATSVSGPNAKALGIPTKYTTAGGTLLRYSYKGDIPDHITTRQHNGGWDVVFSASVPASAGMAVKGAAAANEVTITAAGAAHVLSFSDPELGDALSVVPLPVAGEYIGKARHFSDADLLQTVQGVAAISHGDHTQIGAGLGAVTISGVALSADSGTGAGAAPLYDLASWYAGGPEEINKNRRAIEHSGLGDDSVNERSRAIQLARLYLANGWGNESLATLRLAASIDPDIETSPDFIALRGGASALAGRAEDATTDLTVDTLASQPEAILWRALAEAIGNSDQRQEALSILRSNTKLFEKYPHELKQRFSMALAALAVSAGDLDAMEDALKLLTKGESYDRVTEPAITTLKAAIALQKGKRPESEKLYAAIPALRDQYWTALAGYSAVEGGLAQGTLTQKEAIQKLDALRYEWRGDDFEFEVLEKLGELYLATGDYKDGLETLTNLMNFGAGSKYADDAKHKMIETAKTAFSPETAAGESPLDTYELYNTFVPYLPPGTISDSDVRTLSDRLAAIGVMDQAIALIQPQMDSATDPTAKAKLGARIAALRLLDDKPDLARQALAASEFATIDDKLKTERKLLQAQALFKSGKPDEAVAALQGITTREADALRFEITWNQKNWKDAAAALQRLAGAPGKDGAITDEQANIVLNQAVAYNLGNDPEGLAQLKKTWGDSMAKSKNASAFALMTSPETDTRSPSVESVKASVGGLDIFENYLGAYRKEPTQN